MVDKFIGDGIMAFWGAPVDQIDKENKAVTAAINMVKRLSTLNAGWQKNGDVPISIGIGIHTGVAVVGNMGSNKRFDYTTVDNAVNIAARLEALNKKLNSTIIISNQTRQHLTISIKTDSLGDTEVRGRNEQIGIHKVVVEP